MRDIASYRLFPIRRLVPFLALAAGFVVAIGLAAAGAAWPQAAPHGAEFRIDTYATPFQLDPPDLASSFDGAFTAVWDSEGSPGPDNDGYSIQARRYSPAGAALGPQFQVNTTGFGSQYEPRVGCDALGSCVVVWQDGGTRGIRAQRYSANGAPVGPEFVVNVFSTGTQASQFAPAVAVAPLGQFVVTYWTGQSQTEIWARQYDANGAPLTPTEFLVSGGADTVQRLRPSVASDANGNFVIAWTHWDSTGGHVHARRYSAAGAAQGPEFGVDSSPISGPTPAVGLASDFSGNFIVAWDTGCCTSWTIRAQRFSSTGVAQGGELQVSTITNGVRYSPRVAMEPEGIFLVTWQESANGIRARRYFANGTPFGADFRVDVPVAGFGVISPAATLDLGGNFVIAWQRYAESGGGLSIQGRRFDELFRDDLEKGQTDRWSGRFP